MNINGKIWGFTSKLFNKNNVEIHRLEVNKDGYCSVHKHEHKHNMFFVEHGGLSIEVWKNDYDLVDKTTLWAGQSLVINPGEFHRFTALHDAIVYEIYWVEIKEEDIIRKNCGGKNS